MMHVRDISAADYLIELLEDAVENWFGDMEIDLDDDMAAYAKEKFIQAVNTMLFDDILTNIDLLDSMMEDVSKEVNDKFYSGK